MELPVVYVETSIPSFYHEVRTTPDIVARRDWTRQWWEEATGKYALVTSPAVIDELSAGIPERSAQRLDLIRDLPLLPLEAAITDIAATYIQQKVMPRDPAFRCTSFGHRIVSQVRFPGDLELSASGERQQVRPRPSRQHAAWSVRSGPCHPSRITWSRS
jgi:hypothetical protein